MKIQDIFRFVLIPFTYSFSFFCLSAGLPACALTTPVGADTDLGPGTGKGDTDDGSNYCTELSEGAQTVQWTAFATECWSTSGTAYQPTVSINSIQVYAAGDADSALDFDCCIVDLFPVGI